eukprot:1352660-Amorphochlora_amoeboformis.AAC.3
MQLQVLPANVFELNPKRMRHETLFYSVSPQKYETGIPFSPRPRGTNPPEITLHLRTRSQYKLSTLRIPLEIQVDLMMPFSVVVNLTISASRHVLPFAPSYKEITMLPNGSVTEHRKGVPDCHYTGRLHDHDRSVVYLSTCAGGVHAAIGVSPTKMLEVVYYADENKSPSI